MRIRFVTVDADELEESFKKFENGLVKEVAFRTGIVRWRHLPMKLHLFFVPLLISACVPLGGEPDFNDMINGHGLALGCNWYCGCPPVSVKASSWEILNTPSNLHDGDGQTVWIAAQPGTQSIVFEFDLSDSDNDYGVGADWVSIINGDTRSKNAWKDQARAKAVVVHYNGNCIRRLKLADTMEPQRFDLPKMLFVGGKVNEVTFEIVECYPGKKSGKLAMADFYFSGFGQIH